MAADGEAVPMTLVGVRLELPSNQPIVLLRETNGTRYLPIWVGAVEAQAIAAALDGVEFPRPLTHDLLKSVVEALGASVEKVVLTKLEESVFHADLILNLGGRRVHVSSRPSDAIALAVRTETPLFARLGVIEQAGIEIKEDEDEAEIARFRELLEEVTVEDFLGPGGQQTS